MRISDWSSDVCSSDLSGCLHVPWVWRGAPAATILKPTRHHHFPPSPSGQTGFMSNFDRETILEVHHWTEKLFSFKATRSPSLRFQNGQFAMIGIAVDGQIGRASGRERVCPYV